MQLAVVMLALGLRFEETDEPPPRYTQREIATLLGKSRSTIRNRWNKACARVGRALGYDALRQAKRTGHLPPPEIYSYEPGDEGRILMKLA